MNGNRKAKPLLVEDLRIEFLEFKLSKACIEKTLSEVAVKISGAWRVVERADSSVVVGKNESMPAMV